MKTARFLSDSYDRASKGRAALMCIPLVLSTWAPAPADIFRWDNSELIPGTEGISVGPLMTLRDWNTPERNLRFADFSGGLNLGASDFEDSWLEDVTFEGATLRGVSLFRSSLERANLSTTDLTRANLGGASLSEARLDDAIVNYARFNGSDLTRNQLYSTTSYQRQDLRGLDLGSKDLAGWSFAHQDLSHANFMNASLAGADFTHATINYAYFRTQISANQLYSTSSYQLRDLRGVGFGEMDLTGFDLSGQNLADTYFYNSHLGDADVTNALVNGARFGQSGLTQEQLYSTASYRNGDLSRISLSQLDLSGWDFQGKVLDGAGFSQGTYHGTNFAASSLVGAGMRDGNFQDASFGHADLSRAQFAGSILTGADFTDAVITGAYFNGTIALGFTKEQLYSTVSYRESDLRDVVFGGIYGETNELTGWSFAGQNLSGSRFDDAVLEAVEFVGADIMGASFDNTTDQGFTSSQLYSTASYQRGDLTGVRLSRNDMSGWNFENQQMQRASLSSANLYSTNLRGANLRDGDFFEANLTGSDLTGSNLSNARMYQATLTNADLAGATIAGANLDDVTSNGFTAEQLYSTGSYRSGDLQRVSLRWNDLSGWSFANTDLGYAIFGEQIRPLFSPPAGNTTSLANADLSGAILTGALLMGVDFDGAELAGAVLTAADLRGVTGFSPTDSTVLHNAILPDATIGGLNLRSGESLHVPYDGSQGFDVRFHVAEIVVTDSFVMNNSSELEFEVVIDDDVIGFFLQSTLVLAENVVPQLGGTLRVAGSFYSPVPGRSLKLFDWSGPLDAENRFERIELGPVEGNTRDFNWDISDLYTTGEIRIYEQGLPDYDASAQVDQGDLDLVLLNWGEELFNPYTAGWINDLPAGPINQEELDKVLLGWGDTQSVAASTASVPEPDSWALLLVAVAFAMIPATTRPGTRKGRGWGAV